MSEMSDKLHEAVVELLPSGSIVTSGIVVLGWIDADGDSCWGTFVMPGGRTPATTGVGLLEIAKLDLIARANTGLPISYPTDD